MEKGDERRGIVLCILVGEIFFGGKISCYLTSPIKSLNSEKEDSEVRLLSPVARMMVQLYHPFCHAYTYPQT